MANIVAVRIASLRSKRPSTAQCTPKGEEEILLLLLFS